MWRPFFLAGTLFSFASFCTLAVAQSAENIRQLQAKRKQIQARIDDVEDQARKMGIAPGDLRYPASDFYFCLFPSAFSSHAPSPWGSP